MKVATSPRGKHWAFRWAATAAVALGVLGFTAGTASASTTGIWNLDAPHTDSYTAQVQQPINPDGSSVWPAKRGVIPVQFKLTDTSSYKFESLLAAQTTGTSASGAYSALSFTPSDGTTVSGLNDLTATYAFTTGTNHGGSLRWSINTSAGTVFVYYGDYPSYTNNTLSGQNILGDPTYLRVDTSQVGGTFYDTWTHALTLVGSLPVNYVALVLDSGWGGDQIVNLTSASVNGNGFTFPGATTVQTNAPAAQMDLVRTAGTGTIGSVDESLLTSVQGDAGGNFRQVDGKYIYNLDVSSLGTGTYNVYLKINGADVQSPGVFALR
jgi:hypothetical protein